MDQVGSLVLREAGVSCSGYTHTHTLWHHSFIGKINLQELAYFTLFDKEKLEVIKFFPKRGLIWRLTSGPDGRLLKNVENYHNVRVLVAWLKMIEEIICDWSNPLGLPTIYFCNSSCAAPPLSPFPFLILRKESKTEASRW